MGRRFDPDGAYKMTSEFQESSLFNQRNTGYMTKQFERLESARVDLYCLTQAELENKDLHDRSFENPLGVFTGEDLPRTNRVADVLANPGNIRWYYRMIVDRQRNIAVGSVSFHGAPDENGMVEIGIGIAPEEQGKGYAQEALRAMWDWAITQQAVKSLRYTVSPDNEPSIAIITKFGFPQTGEQIDEEDGLELIFETDVQGYLDLVK